MLTTRSSLLVIVWFLISLLTAGTALAAPEAHILRIDPRASQESGDPTLTTVIEVVQAKRVSEATASCAALRGDGQLDCMSQALEKPGALYTSFPFPAQNAILTVSVDGADRPAKFLSHAEWGESSRQPGVGTAWLILIDADSRMGKAFDDAQELAERFVASMGPSDIVNIMFFNDRQVVSDSKWLAAASKKQAQKFVRSVDGTYRSSGRNRSLLTIIKSAATDGFKALGNVGQDLKVPMHQAMVVLSSGYGGADPSTTGPGALQLQQYMTNGRFPENNTALPKAPVPVISIYFPPRTFDEFRQNSLEFMQNLANPEIGGFFSVMRQGQGNRSKNVVKAVRTRFSKMHIVKWRVACIAPSITQSFKLVFNNVNPPIAGDTTFKEVPVGIDPSTWPLDVNVQYTQNSIGKGVYPGGQFKVFGEFCWGGDKSRAEVYFLPAGQPVPADIGGADIEKAKQAQQQLINQGMKGTAVETADTFAEFIAPEKDKIIHGSGSAAVVRVILYDNKAARASGVTAQSILQLKATTPPFPWLLVLGGALGLVVIALLIILLVRGGGRKRATPQPAAAGGYAAPAPGGYVRPAGGVSPTAPDHGPAMGGGNRATLQGAPGVYTVVPGVEMRAGRDAAQCAVLLNEPRVSGVHATLKLEGGQLLVRDENSNNGTFVNNAQVTAGAWCPIPNGSMLRFGPIEFSVRID